MRKCLFTLSLIFVLMSSFVLPVSGEDLPQIDRDDCSLSVVLQDADTNEGITDGELTCVRVGYIKSINGPYQFCHAVTNKIIDDIESVTAAESFEKDLATYAGQFETYKVDSIADDGTYHFTDLKTGVYLVIQEKSADGYDDLKPFLVTFPYNNNGEYLYHVTADAKTELHKELNATSVPEEKPITPPGNKLPQTGQLYWPIPLMLTLGLAFIVLGWILGQGEKTNQ